VVKELGILMDIRRELKEIHSAIKKDSKPKKHVTIQRISSVTLGVEVKHKVVMVANTVKLRTGTWMTQEEIDILLEDDSINVEILDVQGG